MKLTHDEHTTRAMLMGLVYDWRDGTYCTAQTSNGEPGYSDVILDCETLEPLTPEAARERGETSGVDPSNAVRMWRDIPSKRVPWAVDPDYLINTSEGNDDA
jgi:hypothetical protein